MIEKSFTQNIQHIMKNHQPQPITIPADRINTLIVRINPQTSRLSILEESGPFTYEHERDAVAENINDYQLPEAAILFGPAFQRFIKTFQNMVTSILDDYFFTETTILHHDESTNDVALLFRFIDKDDLRCD
jgi:hypothetical protein